MAKLVGKGTKLQQSVSGTYTTISQLISLDISGSKSGTYDSTTLDQAGNIKTRDTTGYADAATIKFEGFFDPQLTIHHNFDALIESPTATNFKVLYSDGLSSQIMSGVGFGADVKVAIGDAVKWTGTVEVSGTANWP